MRSRDISRISGMYRNSASATIALASSIFKGIGSEFSAYANGLLYGDHQSVLDLSVDPSTYSHAADFRDDYLVAEMLSKYPYLDVKIDREKVALLKFADAERQCSETNSRLYTKVASLRTELTPHGVFHLARLKISALLGPFSWDKAETHFGFGPGSTTSLPKSLGDAYYKFGSSKPHVTKACSVLAYSAIRRIPGWYSSLLLSAGKSPEGSVSVEEFISSCFQIVPGNRVTTVPKSAKTDRVIAIEPDLNMYIQKGIGGLIRGRLKRVGVDLDDQTQNQLMARHGSLYGDYATIDLSSASDTVSLKLCEDLLPADWFEAIKLCRSPRGTLPDGSIITYHKVSSMGNGFTFELESLIFWALCKSVMSLLKEERSRLVVYGDDIIIPVSVYHTVAWILKFAGFTVNPKKSFASGPFRESCGKHFFKGVDVTPFYIRDDIDCPSRLLWFSNSVRRWARHPIYGLDGRLQRAYYHSVFLLPKVLRKPSIPDGLGDIALIGDFDEASPSWSKRLQCWVAVGVGDIRPTKQVDGVPYLLRALSKLEREPLESFDPLGKRFKVAGDEGRIVMHMRKPRWVLVRVPITQWESYGPWLGS